ncbi:MAG TPA: hypothetical protein VKU94_05595 [Geobacterales bacterium]|nr:hypothetical protein [Geobacterales bacterium]
MKISKKFLTLFLIILVIYYIVAYVFLTNIPSQEFYELAIQGKNNEIFPNNNSTITIGEKVQWEFIIVSTFRTPRIVEIVMKLGNNNTMLPNDVNGTPSNGTEIFSWLVYLTYGVKKDYSIEWAVSSVENRSDYYYLILNINNTIIKRVDVGAYKGEKFRIIIELWTLEENGDFRFGWVYQNQLYMIWYQYPFNVTLAKK